MLSITARFALYRGGVKRLVGLQMPFSVGK